MSKENSITKVSIRLVRDREMLSENSLDSPKAIVEFLGGMMCELDREVVCIINIDAALKPINYEVVSMGALSKTIASTREIFKSAILSNASDIIMMHNHPSGSLKPSEEDCQTTQNLINAGGIMGIELMDSIIVGGKNENYFSFREKGILKVAERHWVYTPEQVRFAPGRTKKSDKGMEI